MMTVDQTLEAKRIDQLLDGDELAQQLFGFGDVKADKVPLYYITKDGGLKFRFHKYQKMAMKTKRRFILLLGGTQSGKTSFGPIWLHREIKLRGPGDYLAVAPTYPLMKKKMLPEFLRFFSETLDLGTFNKADKTFVLSPKGEMDIFGKIPDTPTVIYFTHAQDPDSLESATAKAAWLDECGQKKFKLASYEAIMRRLSLFMGRVLMTTTPYYLGWLKQKFWDIWQAGRAAAESIMVISFPSIANPSFPKEEYDRAERELPSWKFRMFYKAMFTRPAGLIYDCFDEAVHKVASFAIPPSWSRFMGLDFGGVNTAGVYLARDNESGHVYVYREYLHGGKSAEQHAKDMLKAEPSRPVAYGGAKSEDQWRREFAKGGLGINRPIVPEVEPGILRVYGAFKTGKLFVFDTCPGLLDELASYSRQLDDMGEPTEKIEDKETFHRLDALRYIVPAVIGASPAFL